MVSPATVGNSADDDGDDDDKVTIIMIGRLIINLTTWIYWNPFIL